MSMLSHRIKYIFQFMSKTRLFSFTILFQHHYTKHALFSQYKQLPLLLYLSSQPFFYFHAPDEYHLYFFFGFYYHTLEYLPYKPVIVFHWMILHTVEDRINLAQPGLRILAFLFSMRVLFKLLSQSSFFIHQSSSLFFIELR